ncbi:mechanosensitive ion channel family protein [Bifidobacterium gallicum]|uniref:Transporter n=1 Tax=Bifidobacterium gallicum DSM 20093 = LMG 11596 TaxID=561180 RepID=D1NUH1_9BIFI|nr:mechanosensitive ion channel domain-containing protein [Bifidobacterium gallicum]EFA23375.1 transporter, small conductance mechanosensitive ion channel MscS family protein [Bifidobacterium gallicum DSM 20093 = LMG 11596]KFI57869.1 transporter [Bifidobacterium gallicum DSM 20093 = LMG 11596]
MPDALLHNVSDFFHNNTGKIIWLVVVFLLALLLARTITRIMQRALAKTGVPNVSLFVNIVRILIWTLAATAVLQPVFGVSPTTVFTALGIGGLALSLGLKDWIANIVSGFDLMVGHVIQPGDVVTISGTTGVVEDITWRQTIVRSRSGNTVLVPNSVLSTSAIEKLNPTTEGLVKVPFTAKSGTDPDKLSKELADLVEQRSAQYLDMAMAPIVKFTGLSPYGITGEIYALAKQGVQLSSLADSVTRAIAHCSLIEQNIQADTTATAQPQK